MLSTIQLKTTQLNENKPISQGFCHLFLQDLVNVIRQESVDRL